ncbi:orotidine-5'-phosphate decarboxylase [Litorimonas taeanensis]|uniref:Orotidine 5'-phosphate decarboxylase n=1 Tax=Litorimonas taeanensis TaxID=568099 RepID=A0A420WED2_9PROT|nr:orotidine-5'-phosphate decarboxylase [Litorimonas taeanensis]RKQ69363.1 orotidine-5'-phosphate decarboxylase [Litorimonas taeanensis]
MTKISDPRLYVALDLPSVAEAEALVETLGDAVDSYKIGLQLLPIGGVEFGQRLKAQGKNVFYDFKLHDIGATVEKATRSIAGLGADLLTVHARPDVMHSAVTGRGESGLKLLGVTVLTSLDKSALEAIGYAGTAEDLVMRRVAQAIEAGMDGVVSSPLEAAAIRAVVPSDFLIVTPGVRMAGGDAGDQKRIATPYDALNNGASHLVVGRPISTAAQPRQAALDVIANMRG